MSEDCSYYFKTGNAIRILSNENKKEYEALYNCLSGLFEKKLKARLMKLNNDFSKEKKAEFAEEAFSVVIIDFFERANAKSLKIYQDHVEGYFYNSLRFSFIKIIKRELGANKQDMLLTYLLGSAKFSYNLADKNFDDEFSDKFNYVWKKVGLECQKLLWWKHVEEMDTQEIYTAKGTGERKSVIAQAWACKEKLKVLFLQSI